VTVLKELPGRHVGHIHEGADKAGRVGDAETIRDLHCLQPAFRQPLPDSGPDPLQQQVFGRLVGIETRDRIKYTG
jgi:hypothetical protein